MKVYSSNDVAEHLKIKTATLRKYCIMLEKEGYSISRNSRNQRYFSDSDVMTIRSIIQAKNNGVTLEESIQGVVHQINNSTVTNEIKSAEGENDSVIGELKELVEKQNELIGRLSERLDEQQQYIERRLNERDKLLLERLDQSLKEQKQLVSEQQESKGFFNRLFKKK